MKILFTSVGRRVELIQAFKKAADKLNIDLTAFVNKKLSQSANKKVSQF